MKKSNLTKFSLKVKTTYLIFASVLMLAFIFGASFLIHQSRLSKASVYANDAPTNLYVPPLAYDNSKITLAWEKPVGYYELQTTDINKTIVDYEVYEGGTSASNLLGRANANLQEENIYQFVWNSRMYDSLDQDTRNKSHKVVQLNYTKHGLNADTEYSFYVRAVYKDNSFSSFSDKFNFRTAKNFSKIIVVDGTQISTTNDNTDTIDNVAHATVDGVASQIIATRNANNEVYTPGSQPSSKWRIANAGAEVANTKTDPFVKAAWDSTQRLQDAIDSVPYDGKLILKGSGDNASPIYYLSGNLFLHSKMTFEIEAGAVLLGSPVIDHYQRNLVVYPYSQDIRTQGLLNAATYDYGSLKDIRVIGGGIVDGNGVRLASDNFNDAGIQAQGGIQASNTKNDPATYSNSGGGAGGTWNDDFVNDIVDPTNGGGVGQWRLPYYKPTASGNTIDNTPGILSWDTMIKGSQDGIPSPSSAYNSRPQLAIFRGVDGLSIEGLTWVNPSFHGVVHYQSENLTFLNNKVLTFNNHNGDGVEYGDSRGMHVINSFFDTGDDAVNFAAGQGAVVRNTSDRVATGEGRIFNTYVRNGHGGFIAAGSHTSGWIGDLLAEENIYSTSETGGNGALRMKSSGYTGGGNRNLTLRDTLMHFTISPSKDGAILIDRNYSDANASTAYAPESEVPTVYDNITIRNITLSGVLTKPLIGQTDTNRQPNSYLMIAKNFHVSDIAVLELGGTASDVDAGSIKIGDIYDSQFENISLPQGRNIVFKQDVGNSESGKPDKNYEADCRNIVIKNVSGDNGNQKLDDQIPLDLNWTSSQSITSTVDGNKVNLAWNNPSNATLGGKYLVLVRDTATKPNGEPLQRYFAKRAEIEITQDILSSGSVSFDATLSANTTYELQVVAQDSLDSNKHMSVSTSPLTGRVTTGAKNQTEEAPTLPTTHPNIGNADYVGISWQEIRWTTVNSDGIVDQGTVVQDGNSSGVQYYKILAIKKGTTQTIEYRAYFDSYLTPTSPLYHKNRGAYALSGLEQDTEYDINLKVVTWIGEEYGNWNTLSVKTFVDMPKELPKWSDDAVLNGDQNGNELTLSWDITQVTNTAREDENSWFAGFRIYVDGVAIKTVSESGEVASQVNAVPTTIGTSYTVDLNNYSEGEHTFSVEAGLEIKKFLIPSTGGSSAMGDFAGADKSEQRNNVTMGRWTGVGPSIKVNVGVNKTQAQEDYTRLKETKNDNYTKESWDLFVSKLSNMETVLANLNATQNQVDTARTELLDAFKGLTKNSGGLKLEVIIAIIAGVVVLCVASFLVATKTKKGQLATQSNADTNTNIDTTKTEVNNDIDKKVEVVSNNDSVVLNNDIQDSQENKEKILDNQELGNQDKE